MENSHSAPPGWLVVGQSIERHFSTGTFNRGLTFVNALAKLADEADHHPDITLTYPTVTVSLTTHDLNRVTAKDLALAKKISDLWEDQFAT